MGSIKSIDLMSVHHPYACLNEESFITVRHVENHRKVRLSRSKGNVNLTDFWFTILDSLETNNKSCSCQNIGLLADVSAEADWWSEQNGKNICIGFLKIASSQQITIREAMVELENIICGKGRLFRTLDNADLILVLSVDGDKRDLLDDLVDKVIGYEINGETVYFSRFFVYGKGKKQKGEDFFRIESLNTAQDKGRYCQKHSWYDQGWCDRLISKMVQRISEYKGQRNKKMMSYYQALLQILKVLGQYEQRTLHKDLFYIFYPPISTFISQLEESQMEVDRITERIAPGISFEDRQKLVWERQAMNVEIEKSISRFLDTMELLMHHIGQSCEEIVGSTGHGGMPYDIPLRISLMYVAFLNVLTDVLVEKKVMPGGKTVQRKEFAYCLCPLAYAQPSTMGFNIGDTEKSRLIRVKMPRHILFMPRSFLVILAHEASHYAHEESRMRSERAKCIRKIVEFVISVTLVPNSLREELVKQQKESAVLQEYLDILCENIQKYLEKTLYDAIELEGGSDPQRYHLDIFTDKIKEVCLRIAYDENHNLERCVSGLDNVTVKAVRNVKKYPDLYGKIADIQKKILQNAGYIVFDEGIYKFIDNLKRVFREIYADFSAIRLLDLSWEDYLEAYIISESCTLNYDEFPPETLNRLAMVKYVLAEKNTDGWRDTYWERLMDEDQTKYGWRDIQEMKRPINKYIEQIEVAVRCRRENLTGADIQDEEEAAGGIDWFNCNEILALEAEFFMECDNALSEYIMKSGQEDNLCKLRNLYQSFAVKPRNQDGSFSAFFEAFDQLTDIYKGAVDQKYKNDLQKMSAP